MKLTPLKATLVLVLIVFGIPAVHAESKPDLKQGVNKTQALAALRALGVDRLILGIHPEITVSRPADIERLQEAEAINFGAGRSIIGFDGDAIIYTYINPAYPEHHEYQKQLAGVKTRSEALAVLRSILASQSGQSVRNSALLTPAGLRPEVSLLNLGPPEQAMLERYDKWSGYYKATVGYWQLTIRFEDNTIAEIQRDWLPALK